MVPAGNKAKRLSSVNHTMKTIHHRHHHHIKNFGFKVLVTPPQNEDLNTFESDMYDMIRNIKFTSIRNEFLDHLNKDTESIRSSKNMLVFVDKSTDLYELSSEYYHS